VTAPADTAVARVRQDDLIPGYRLVQLVGKGGMGEVHQAVQLSLGRTVAVKLLKPELAQDEQFVARFEKEAAALATLRHPNVVSIVDRGKASGTYYLVMEFVDGPSLRERMRDPDFDAMAALKTLVQVGRAIDYAHGRGVIHRDLKPENILFDEQAGSIPKVTDFGLAGFDEKAGSAVPQNLTQTNVAMGTASYMAPEQRVDAKSAGPRADLYALGVMLYELMTGEVPLGQFDPPSVKKPGVDRRLDAIVAKCLKPAPEDRYPTVAAFLAELETLVPMSSVTALAKETKAKRLLRLAKERVQKAARVVAIGIVAFAAVIVTTVFLRARLETKREPAGMQLMRDDGAQQPVTSAGRLDKAARTVTLGEGPDTVTVVARGRAITMEKGTVTFPPPDEVTAGRALVDAAVEGDGLTVSAVVDTQAVTPSRLEPLFALFRGPRPEARSALMLLGDAGRYVALIISGSGSPPELEWNLGPDRQGRMTAPLPSSTKKQQLTLRLDPSTNELTAIVGEGRDSRVLGEPIHFGAKWHAEFSETPRAALGCLDGTCTFRSLVLEGQVLPPPPPPAPIIAMDEPVVQKPAEKKPPPKVLVPLKPPTTVAAKPQGTKAPPPPTKKPPPPVTPPKKK